MSEKINSISSENRAIATEATSEDMPVIAGGLVTASLASRPETESLMIQKYIVSAAECGFKLGAIHAASSNLVKFLKKYQNLLFANDQKLFLSIPTSNGDNSFEEDEDTIKQLISDIKEIDTKGRLAGWMTRSEPKFNDLGNSAMYYDCYQDNSENTETLMTLIGTAQEAYTGDFSYQIYLLYLLSYMPKLTPILPNQKIFLSTVGLTSEGAEHCQTRVYYENLLVLLDFSKTYTRPFWTYCNCMQMYTILFEKTSSEGLRYYNTHSRPALTLDTIRYKIFTAFAYGSHGLYFYDYARRKCNETDFFGETLAETYKEGGAEFLRKSPEWYAAKQVISEVRRYQTIFKDSVIASVKHIDKNGITSCYSISDIKPSVKPIDGLMTIELCKPKKEGESCTPNGEGVVVSRIKSSSIADGDWLMIVNKSPYCPQEVYLTFDQSSFEEETAAKFYTSVKETRQRYYNRFETSAVWNQKDVKVYVGGRFVNRVQQSRVLYPGAYIIFRVV